MQPPILTRTHRSREDGELSFVVTRSGRFGGRLWREGDVVVCSGEPGDGEQVVLVARGHGRPRLGSVRGPHLFGDAEEACHPQRWRAAGRIQAVHRRAMAGWVVEWVAEPERRQLALFQALAA
jgi:hypothetical protein